jgi:hypothetical protein
MSEVSFYRIRPAEGLGAWLLVLPQKSKDSC